MKPASRRTSAGSVRIVGGSLRGSKLAVADAAGLRPTPDRVRETLFNWLMPSIAGARVLDLFAGTGALGIEALSRGAAQVDFIERDAQLAQALRDNLARLRQAMASVRQVDALSLLAQPPSLAYDLIFLDPPFDADLWAGAADRLEANAWIKANALIYVESPVAQVPILPATWSLHREGRAGAVRYALYRQSAKLGDL
jgi:16S rRNA (guanine966-N2)-methyltransferase